MAILKIRDEFNNDITLDVIAKAERRVAKKKEVLEDIQNEYELLEKQAFGLYKSGIGYYMLDCATIGKAAKWLCMVEKNKDADGNKLDKRKKYEEKDAFIYISDTIKKLLDLEDFEITSILDYNYRQGKHIEFSSHGHNWILEVPWVSNVTLKSYQYTGKYVFMLMISHIDSTWHSTVVGSTFEEDELKDIMKDAIEKYCSVDNGGD